VLLPQIATADLPHRQLLAGWRINHDRYLKPMATELVSGAWRDAAEMTDYRSERFTDMLVERATWTVDAPLQKIDETIVAGPDYIWFRFWLMGHQQVVDRYFSAERQAVGMLAPISGPFLVTERTITSVNLLLALWLQNDGRITVLNEAEFDVAVAAQIIAQEQAEYAEQRIRELTLDVSQNLFPPAMVRNFILKDSEET
jgi:hypothetical protein